MWLIIWAETHLSSFTVAIQQVCETRDAAQQSFTREDGVVWYG